MIPLFRASAIPSSFPSLSALVLTAAAFLFTAPLTLRAQNSDENAASTSAPAAPSAIPAPAGPLIVHVADEPTHAVSPLLFGQFLERFSDKPYGRENGPQAAIVPDSPAFAWQPGVVDALRQLRATNIRFPGGGALEGIADWTVMIDHSPFRTEAARPKGYEVGYEEYFALCRELRAEPLIAVNFRSAVWGETTPLPPEQLAAGLVAYCNLPVGAKLPEGMPDWPALRAKNGHPEPHRVKYFQLGNEWVAWLFATNIVQKKLGRPELTDPELSARLRNRAADMLRAMKAVDPSIKLVIDAVLFRESDDAIIREFLNDPAIKSLADFAAVHLYRPWGVQRFTLDDQKISPDDLTANQLWLASVGTPDIDENGFSTLASRSWNYAREAGWKVVLTEWNWNGWNVERHGATPWVRGLGAAGFLHAMIRHGEHIHLANQSMMLGDDWTIAGVRVDPAARRAPFVMPTAQVTGFYSQFAGTRFTPLRFDRVPIAPQRVSMGSIKAAPKLALVDTVATESPDKLVLHFINRDPVHARTVTVRLGEKRRARLTDAPAHLHVLAAKPWNAFDDHFISPNHVGTLAEPTPVTFLDTDPGVLTVTLPAGTVGALVVPQTAKRTP